MNGRNPKRKEKMIIKKNRLNPDNWLVLKKLLSEEKREIIVIKNKINGNERRVS